MAAMADSDSIDDLMLRIQLGDEDAVREVCDRYADRLLHLAEKEIGQRLRKRYSPDEARDSVMGSFMIHARNGEYHFDHSGAMWSLLRTILQNKVRKKVEYHTAQKRDVGRDEVVGSDVLDRAILDPQQAIELADILEHVFKQLPEHYELIFKLWQENYQYNEIAQRVGYSRFTVRRAIDRCKQMLREAYGVEPDNTSGNTTQGT